MTLSAGADMIFGQASRRDRGRGPALAARQQGRQFPASGYMATVSAPDSATAHLGWAGATGRGSCWVGAPAATRSAAQDASKPAGGCPRPGRPEISLPGLRCEPRGRQIAADGHPGRRRRDLRRRGGVDRRRLRLFDRSPNRWGWSFAVCFCQVRTGRAASETAKK
jgi:hypothetical protein